MTQHNAIAQIRSDFIERTGIISQAEGLPRIAGRIFGALIFDGNMVAFGDLATDLQVSRASISTSIRILEERGLVKRASKPGTRGDFFQLANDPFATMLKGIQHRSRRARDDIDTTISQLAPDHAAAKRLAAYANFYAATDNVIGRVLDDLNDNKSGQQPAAPRTKDDE